MKTPRAGNTDFLLINILKLEDRNQGRKGQDLRTRIPEGSIPSEIFTFFELLSFIYIPESFEEPCHNLTLDFKHKEVYDGIMVKMFYKTLMKKFTKPLLLQSFDFYAYLYVSEFSKTLNVAINRLKKKQLSQYI